ncbi:hypothetical protein BpHYR1_047370 [Brachionus plicatilis]|uniref:Uncharacterized protein n=1 Tax=Brachionus plicatilis TaxID=10195 RepID=A0A3M7PHM5_BRAPC|nr:hypothetical protein BpHYR1_047370 [Brachionus plicatilis]
MLQAFSLVLDCFLALFNCFPVAIYVSGKLKKICLENMFGKVKNIGNDDGPSIRQADKYIELRNSLAKTLD